VVRVESTARILMRRFTIILYSLVVAVTAWMLQGWLHFWYSSDTGALWQHLFPLSFDRIVVRVPLVIAAVAILHFYRVARKLTAVQQENARNALAESLRKEEPRTRQAEAMLASLRAVLSNDDFKTAAKAILDQFKGLVSATTGYIASLSDDGKSNEIHYLDPGPYACKVDPHLPMPIRGIRELGYKSSDVVYDNDYARSEWQKFVPPGHVLLENVLFAPLKINEKVIGLIGVANKPGGFTPEDGELALTFADYAALALMKSRAIETSRESQHKLEVSQQQLRHLVAQLCVSEERQRRQFAERLHDTVLQNLTLLKMKAHTLKTDCDDPHLATNLADMLGGLDAAMQEARSLTNGLSPPALHQLGLVPALEEWLQQRIRDKWHIETHLDADADLPTLDDDIKAFLFRSICELAMNVVKYACADRLDIRITRTDDNIIATVTDDGTGCNPAEALDFQSPGNHFGLFSIYNRVLYWGGTMDMESSPGTGTKVTLTLPVEHHPVINTCLP